MVHSGRLELWMMLRDESVSSLNVEVDGRFATTRLLPDLSFVLSNVRV